MKNLISILFLFVSFNSYSQFDKVKMYFNDSTSIEGFGYYKKDKIFFKLDEKDEFSEWGLESVYKIDFYGFENALYTFEYIFCDKYNKFRLMQLVVEGEVNLYKIEDTNIVITSNGGDIKSRSFYTSKTEEYFVKHIKDKTAIDILFGFKKKVARFFSDCPDIIEMVNDKTFTRDDIELIVVYYNKNCST